MREIRHDIPFGYARSSALAAVLLIMFGTAILVSGCTIDTKAYFAARSLQNAMKQDSAEVIIASLEASSWQGDQRVREARKEAQVRLSQLFEKEKVQRIKVCFVNWYAEYFKNDVGSPERAMREGPDLFQKYRVLQQIVSELRAKNYSAEIGPEIIVRFYNPNKLLEYQVDTAWGDAHLSQGRIKLDTADLLFHALKKKLRQSVEALLGTKAESTDPVLFIYPIDITYLTNLRDPATDQKVGSEMLSVAVVYEIYDAHAKKAVFWDNRGAVRKHESTVVEKYRSHGGAALTEKIRWSFDESEPNFLSGMGAQLMRGLPPAR